MVCPVVCLSQIYALNKADTLTDHTDGRWAHIRTEALLYEVVVSSMQGCHFGRIIWNTSCYWLNVTKILPFINSSRVLSDFSP